MRRKLVVSSLATAGLLAVGLLWQFSGHGIGQSVQVNSDKNKGEGPLPIKQVVLFNSGVGYFQREGDVEGNTRVDLTFPVGDINDLLKSMVLQDLGGGRVSSVNYDSHDPIDKILRSFALDLTHNPTFGQLLNQARGEKIELLRLEKKEPVKLTATIVGLETKQQPTDKGQLASVEYLNLSGPNGMQSVALEQVLGVRFLNQVLENEFQRALKVLAGAHDMQKKTVSLGFSGVGKRPVKVGYVVERPIWKTTYRLRLDPNGKLSLQGWALVENPSDDDWNDVRMVLVSGRPISYQMNLYEPLYIPRPFVEPELFASLRPPVYGGAMPGMAADQPAAPPAERDLKARADRQEQANKQFAPGMGGQLPGMFNPANQLQNLNKLTYEELQQRRQQQQQLRDEAKKKGSAVAGLNFKEGIQSVATAEEVGDYYQYVLDQKISLPRQKSAMLPILDHLIEGHKVSIFNESIHTRYPLLGLKLKNTSGQPLTQGPVTVYEGGSYAGDTRILDLQPNEERFLSYALDQGTEIKTQIKANPSPDMNFTIGSNSLAARYKMRETKTYTLKNRSTNERTVIVEHPIRTDWKLINPQKPAEQSRRVYRFQVTVAPGKAAELEVVEEQARTDSVALIAPSKDRPPYYAVSIGVEVKPIVHVGEEKLTALRITKGLVIPTYKVRESKSYFVQNLSEQDRHITVDHVVRKDWVRLADKETQPGPAVFRFMVEVAKGKTANQEVVEERTATEKPRSLKEVPEAKLREFLTSPVVSAAVKKGLTEVLSRTARLGEARRQLADLEKQLETLSKDQDRLRRNLAIIPQSAEPYKQFLQKFVTQEGEIDNLQRQIRQLQAAVLTQERELDAFLVALTVE